MTCSEVYITKSENYIRESAKLDAMNIIPD